MKRQLLSTVSALAFSVLIVTAVPTMALAQTAAAGTTQADKDAEKAANKAEKKVMFDAQNVVEASIRSKIRAQAHALGLTDPTMFDAAFAVAMQEVRRTAAYQQIRTDANNGVTPNTNFTVDVPRAEFTLKHLSATYKQLATNAQTTGVTLTREMVDIAAKEVLKTLKVEAANATIDMTLATPVGTPHADVAIKQVKGAQDKIKADAALLGIPADYPDLKKLLANAADEVVREVENRYKLGYAIPDQIIPPRALAQLNGVKEKAIDAGLIKLTVVTITLPAAGQTKTLINGFTVDSAGLIKDKEGRVIAEITDGGEFVNPITGKALQLSRQAEWLGLFSGTQTCAASALAPVTVKPTATGDVDQSNSYVAATDDGKVYTPTTTPAANSTSTASTTAAALSSACAQAHAQFDNWQPGRSEGVSVGETRNDAIEGAIVAIMGQPNPLAALAQWQKNYKAPYELNKYQNDIVKSVRATVTDQAYTQLAKELNDEWKASGSTESFDKWLRKEKFDLLGNGNHGGSNQTANMIARSRVEDKQKELEKLEDAQRQAGLETLVRGLLTQPDPRKAFIEAKDRGDFTYQEANTLRHIIDQGLNDGQSGKHSVAWLMAGPDPVKAAEKRVSQLKSLKDKGHGYPGLTEEIREAQAIAAAVKKLSAGGTLTQQDKDAIVAADAAKMKTFQKAVGDEQNTMAHGAVSSDARDTGTSGGSGSTAGTSTVNPKIDGGVKNGKQQYLIHDISDIELLPQWITMTAAQQADYRAGAEEMLNSTGTYKKSDGSSDIIYYGK